VAARKTVTRPTLSGEQGINLMERRCLEMVACSTRARSITATTRLGESVPVSRGERDVVAVDPRPITADQAAAAEQKAAASKWSWAVGFAGLIDVLPMLRS